MAISLVDLLQAEAQKCARCSACQQACPIFEKIGFEASGPRGKIQLALALVKGQLSLTPTLRNKFSLCLSCGACTLACPSGVRVELIMEMIRSFIAEHIGLPAWQKLLFKVFLPSLPLQEIARRVGHLTQRAGLGPLGSKGMPLPQLPWNGFRSSRGTPQQGQEQAQVIFFQGCLLRHVFPDISRAVCWLLEQNGVHTIVLPSAIACCGTPARINGDRQGALRLARRNVGILSSFPASAVITACGSCGLTLKDSYIRLLQDDPEYGYLARELSAKVMDISDFLSRSMAINLIGFPFTKITYHDPCHLARGMQVRREPRQLLSSIPGVTLVEMLNADKCCGSGGTFCLSHYPLSASLGREKIINALESDAELLTTGCPACYYHLKHSASVSGAKIKVMHTAEALAAASGFGAIGDYHEMP